MLDASVAAVGGSVGKGATIFGPFLRLGVCGSRDAEQCVWLDCATYQDGRTGAELFERMVFIADWKDFAVFVAATRYWALQWCK